MRLIDADKLINQGYEIVVDGWQYDTCNKSIDIDDIPTAYDIGEVVEKLEEIRAKKTCNKEKCDTKEICRICVVDDAIEIVKQGGLSDDVCEWESDYGFVSDKYKRETGCGYTFYDLHHAVPFKYCPYCGKKIKVVE